MKYFTILVLGIAILSCEPRFFNASSPAMEGTLETGSKIYIHEGDVKRNDIVAFNLASESGSYFVFRMIAVPGDSLEIKNGVVSINGQTQEYPSTIQYGYNVQSTMTIRDRYFEKLEIKEFIRTSDGHIVHTTPNKAKKLNEAEFVKSVTRLLTEPKQIDQRIFKDFQGWNKDNFGLLYIPQAGETISGEEIKKYIHLIKKYESPEFNNDSSYTFKNSYAFVLGDNRDNAADSRYIGLIPMNTIIGKVESL